MNIKTGYKQTEIGVIPEDWEVKTIKEISNPVRGGSPRPAGSPKYFNGDYIPWLTVAALTNIPESQIFVSETEGYLTKEGSLHSRTLEKETLIIANSGATLGVAKLLAIKCCANDGIAALFDVDKNAEKRFVVYYINSLTKKLRTVIATGNGQPNLNTDLIGNIAIPYPPLPEQTAIAAALSDVDVLISELDKLIAKKRDIKQATMQQLLTGKKRLAGFSGEWEVKRLGELLKVRHGKSQHHISVKDGTFPILATGGEIGRTNHYLYNKPSVLIGRKGTIDVPQYIEKPFWTIDTLFYTEISENVSAKFVFYKFQTINWRGYNEASGVPSLNASTIENIESIIPPTKKEQTAIATILSDMDAEINALQQKRDKTAQLKTGMMQELLTGRIRLVSNNIIGETP